MEQFEIYASLTFEEFQEICGLVWGADRMKKKDGSADPLFTAMRKIKESCISQCDDEMLDHLNTITKAIESVFKKPSVERGMLQGGLQGLTDAVMQRLDNDEV